MEVKTKVKKVVNEVSKKEKPKSVPIVFPSKRKALLKSDGRIYGITSPYGSIVSSPMLGTEILFEMAGKTEKVVPEEQSFLLQNPDGRYRVPVEFVRLWARQLLDYDTEALCIYGVNRRDPKKWLAVVPEQEVTGASVDVDDFGTGVQTLSSLGYRVVGTLHTHPGGMTGCSSTDTGELWNKFSGLHLIVTHTGILSWYFSTRGTTWDLKRFEEFGHTPLWPGKRIPFALKKGHELILGEDGGKDYDKFISDKWSYIGYQGYQGVGYQRGTQSYTRTTMSYQGIFDRKKKEWVYVEQKKGIQVDFGYTQVYDSYWDISLKRWFAGRPTKKELKRNPNRFTIKNPPIVVSEIQKEQKRKEEKSIEICTCLADVGDRLLEKKGGDFIAQRDRLEIESCLCDFVTTVETLDTVIEDYLTGSDKDADTVLMLKELCKFMPWLEKIIWGKLGKEEKDYIKLFKKGD